MKIWITADGQKLNIAEMSKDYIQNAIKVLENNIQDGTYAMDGRERVKRAKLYIKTLERELNRRKRKYGGLRQKLETLL